jgi:hypothetical protein
MDWVKREKAAVSNLGTSMTDLPEVHQQSWFDVKALAKCVYSALSPLPPPLGISFGDLESLRGFDKYGQRPHLKIILSPSVTRRSSSNKSRDALGSTSADWMDRLN